jgi:tetratricopeptide (TPR) repeat protein
VGPVGQLFRARELAETEAKIKALEAAGLMSVTQAKIQFQSQIMSLFLQRRFQHALIASSFYRFIFKGSHQNLEVGKKELSAFLPSTDLALTVETIEFLSREAINDVNSGMAAVRSNYDDNRKVAAIERLQETFFLGEYLPAVTQFEPARKEALLTLYRKVDEARKLADLRDFDAVLKLTEEIGSLTADFRSPEVTAAVRSAQRMSTLSLNAAQQAAATGDYAKAQEFVEKAAQLWPLNPAIKNYTENMASQADLGTQAAAVFDDAFKRDDFRRIYERRAELAVQTEELLAQNNAFSAWEALAAATTFAPNDVLLNQRMAQLAPRVAEFVGRLDQAKRYESEQRYAASLTQFLAAQDIHPASQIARVGLTRVSEEIMNQLAAEVPAAVPAK